MASKSTSSTSCWIGSRLVVKDPSKSSKNFRCKINAAKLKMKKLEQHGWEGLQAHNDAKRKAVDSKLQKEVENIQNAKITGQYASHKRIGALESELDICRKKLQETESDNHKEMTLRKAYERKCYDFFKELEERRGEHESLWSLIRQQKRQIHVLQDRRSDSVARSDSETLTHDGSNTGSSSASIVP